MVKLAPRGSQDPSDSSLQMKVYLISIFRSDNISLWVENNPPNKTQLQKSMLSDYSPETTSSLNPNSGITWEDNSKQKALKDKFYQSTKSLKKDQTTLKLSVLFWDINPEQATTTCTNNTEMSLWMEPSVNSTWKWVVITELILILFQLSEQSS